MKKLFFSLFFIYRVISILALKEIPMLENENKQVYIEEKKITPVKIESEEKNIEKELDIEEIVNENLSSNEIDLKEDTENEEEKILIEEKLDEEKLQEILKYAAQAPVPEVLIDVDEEDNEKLFLTSDVILNNDVLSLDSNSLVKKYYDFLESFNEKLQEHNFKDKTEVIHIGHEVAKELTSDKVVPNLEVGVGMMYRGNTREAYYFDQEQSGKYYIKEITENESDWDSIPIYATGKYKLSQRENGGLPYLKLNFGYSVSSIEGKSFQSTNSKYRSISNSLNYESGAYYGVGGGIEYDSGLTLDLMYQINEGRNSRNKNDGENRVTFSVEYKLDI